MQDPAGTRSTEMKSARTDGICTYKNNYYAHLVILIDRNKDRLITLRLRTVHVHVVRTKYECTLHLTEFS